MQSANRTAIPGHFTWIWPDEGLRLGAEPNYFISIAGDASLLAGETFDWSVSYVEGVGPSWLFTDLPGIEGEWRSDHDMPEIFAFRLDGHVVPEPASLTLLGAGLVGRNAGWIAESHAS